MIILKISRDMKIENYSALTRIVKLLYFPNGWATKANSKARW